MACNSLAQFLCQKQELGLDWFLQTRGGYLLGSEVALMHCVSRQILNHHNIRNVMFRFIMNKHGGCRC